MPRELSSTSPLQVTPYMIAERFIGLHEVPSWIKAEPQILAMLKLDNTWPDDDHVPWCSAFVNYVAWLLRLPRSKSLRARSWLKVGVPTQLEDARVGYDVIVLKRSEADPGPHNLTAKGHVGFFAGMEGSDVYILGGNQHDEVNVSPYHKELVIGVRRLRGTGVEIV